MLNYCDHVRAMLGPCWNHFGPFWTMFCLVLDNIREMFGSSCDKVLPSIPYSLLFTPYLSLFFFIYLLKFYSGRAVDLWSCFSNK